MVKEIEPVNLRTWSAGAVAGEHYAVGFGVEALEEFFDESRLYPTGFFGMDQIAHYGFEPGVFTDAE